MLSDVAWVDTGEPWYYHLRSSSDWFLSSIKCQFLWDHCSKMWREIFHWNPLTLGPLCRLQRAHLNYRTYEAPKEMRVHMPWWEVRDEEKSRWKRDAKRRKLVKSGSSEGPAQVRSSSWETQLMWWEATREMSDPTLYVGSYSVRQHCPDYLVASCGHFNSVHVSLG